MAAQEYYLGTQAAAELQGHTSPRPFSPQKQSQSPYQQPGRPFQPQQQYASPYANTPPPSYSTSFQPPPNQQLQTYAPYPAQASPSMAPPYPTTPPARLGHYPPPHQQGTYTGSSLKPTRSHSQPARVHFAQHESDDSSDESASSDSDRSSRRRRRHRRHSHSHAHGHDSDHDSRERERHHRSKTRAHERRDRDTFLGAGAGGIIGDAIFPGLGTAAGLLLGGLGGRKYAKRPESEDSLRHRARRDSYYDDRDEGRYGREERY